MQPDTIVDSARFQQSRLSTSTSLINDLKGMSQERWYHFVLIYSPLIKFWIRQKSIPTQFEDDIFQECLHSIYSGIQDFDRNSLSGTFRGWLRTIVQRRVADFYRHQQLERPTNQQFFETIASPQQRDPLELEAEQKEFVALQARAFAIIRAEVDEKTWQKFWLSTMENVPNAEIAKKFGITEAGVRLAKSRVIQKFRALMFDDVATATDVLRRRDHS